MIKSERDLFEEVMEDLYKTAAKEKLGNFMADARTFSGQPENVKNVEGRFVRQIKDLSDSLNHARSLYEEPAVCGDNAVEDCNADPLSLDLEMLDECYKEHMRKAINHAFAYSDVSRVAILRKTYEAMFNGVITGEVI